MGLKQKYTVSEATEFLGFKSRSTINKRTKASGNDSISYEIDDQGNKVISILELERAFPDKYKEALKRNTNTPNKHSVKIQQSTTKNTSNTSVLEAQIQMLQEQIEYERREREREREDAQKQLREAHDRENKLQDRFDKLTDVLGKQTLLLEDMRQKSDKPKETEPRKKFLGIF